MHTRSKLAFGLAFAALGALAPLGCGATFDPPTEIKSLRILGVSKDKPYAEPGNVVRLSMLFYDGTRPIAVDPVTPVFPVIPGAAGESGGGAGGQTAPSAGESAGGAGGQRASGAGESAGGAGGQRASGAGESAGGAGGELGAGAGKPASGGTGGSVTTSGRQVKLTWLGGCLNPPADSYSGCLAQYAQAFDSGQVTAVDGVAPADLPAGGITFGTGADFRVRIPTDAEAGPRGPVLHASQDPRLPYYGLSYVFFALCAGDIVPGDEHFPIHCQDANGNDLGPDDFVLGYSAIYFFEHGPTGEPYVNTNPITTGLHFGPAEVGDVSCFGDECLGSCADGVCTNPSPERINRNHFPTLYMPACKDDGDPLKCPAHDLRLDINAATFEPDQVTNDAYGRGFKEQMWIDYYSTRGRFRSATKLLNDATKGYNHENGTQFYAPKERGPVDLWVVLHDNRGGVSWVGTTLMIE